MLPEHQRRQLAPVLLVGAVVVAPFLAFLYSPRAGLVMMTIGLGATAWLIRETLPAVAPPMRRRLQMLLAVNLALALVCVVALFLV